MSDPVRSGTAVPSRSVCGCCYRACVDPLERVVSVS